MSDRDLTNLEAGIFLGEDLGKDNLATDIINIIEADGGFIKYLSP